MLLLYRPVSRQKKNDLRGEEQGSRKREDK